MKKIYKIDVCRDLGLWGDRSDSLMRSLAPKVSDKVWVGLERPIVVYVHYLIENSITEKLEEIREYPNIEV